jgi:hypothetical protein
LSEIGRHRHIDFMQVTHAEATTGGSQKSGFHKYEKPYLSTNLSTKSSSAEN